MRQYETFELAIPGPVLSDHWAQADVQAVFTHGGITVTVPGFYAGDGVYKVRFLPMESGEYTWRVSGAVSAEGQEICAPATTHGPIHTQGRGFVYADGTPYHPFGTTIYALAFAEAGNCWTSVKDFSPFNLKRSAGVGIRIYLSMLGTLGIDWGYGFDQVWGRRGGSQLHFVLGQEF